MIDRNTVRRLTDILLPGIGEGYPFPDFAGFVESLWRFCRERPTHLSSLNIPSSQWRKFPGANTMFNGTRAYMTYREILTEQRVLRQVIPHDPGRHSAIYGVNFPLEGSNPWDDVRRRAGMFAVLAGAMRSRRFRRIEERLRGSGGGGVVNNMLAVLFAAFTDAGMDACLSWPPDRGPQSDLTVFDPSGEPCLVATAGWEPDESDLETLCELGCLFPDAGLVCISLAAPSPELSGRALASGIGMVCHSPPRNGRRRTGIMSTSWVPTHSSDTDHPTVETVELVDHPPSGGPSRSSMPLAGCPTGRTASSNIPPAPIAAPSCS